jgi:hypothetical protein
MKDVNAKNVVRRYVLSYQAAHSAYMAYRSAPPEQGEAYDLRSRVYSTGFCLLGMMEELYGLLEGSPVSTGGKLWEMYEKGEDVLQDIESIWWGD